MARKQKILTEPEDAFVRKLLMGAKDAQLKPRTKSRYVTQRTPAFKHYNSDGFSHTSMSAAFRRYGKRN